jgi:hypothetical protein
MRIEYLARRNLAPGHDTEESYEIVVFAAELNPSVDFATTRNISLDRSRVETDLWGVDNLIDVTTDLIPIGQQTKEFEEFLWSVAAGETFTFDPDSDVAGVAVSAKTCAMESSGYRPNRFPGHLQYSFTVRVL